MSSMPVSGVPSSSSWPLPQANSPRESPSENSNNTGGSAGKRLAEEDYRGKESDTVLCDEN